MTYELFPPVREIAYKEGACALNRLAQTAKSAGAHGLTVCLPSSLQPPETTDNSEYWYEAGEGAVCPSAVQAQGYAIAIAPGGLTVRAADRAGLRYGLDTLCQIIRQAQGQPLQCLNIADWPALPSRGLMLDVSRGKVYTRWYLLGLCDMLSKFRYNVFQLYMEHSFEFKSHPEMSKGSGPLTAEDILALKSRCSELGIELQANLQSLGHCRRILTRPRYGELAESDMFWSLCVTDEKSLALLDDLYAEYLPLFDSPWFNVCLDEPYDLGRGKSAGRGMDSGELYLTYLLRLHKLSAKYGKRLMLFGDVFLRHPELLSRVPKDVLLIDWIYDPKKYYGTPALYHNSGLPFWVCPGTGNWNTLFPRLEGALINIVNLTLEGIREGARGMLLTDWNDHGGYAQPSPGYYLYSYAGCVAWRGEDPGKALASAFADRVLDLPGYGETALKIAEIYAVPPIWSKNRSQCVMALFDEPVFGHAIRGPQPPEGLRANDLNLPAGVRPVLERHSQHPMRPYFCIPTAAIDKIRLIVNQAEPMVKNLKTGIVRDQFLYTVDAFHLMLDKLNLSRRIIKGVADGANIHELLQFEDSLRLMIARYVRLQMVYARNWLAVANFSELDLSMVYFAHIIARLDYLRDWLSLQREKLSRQEEIDREFESYQTGGYGTLPTY